MCEWQPSTHITSVSNNTHNLANSKMTTTRGVQPSPTLCERQDFAKPCGCMVYCHSSCDQGSICWRASSATVSGEGLPLVGEALTLLLSLKVPSSSRNWLNSDLPIACNPHVMKVEQNDAHMWQKQFVARNRSDISSNPAHPPSCILA